MKIDSRLRPRQHSPLTYLPLRIRVLAIAAVIAAASTASAAEIIRIGDSAGGVSADGSVVAGSFVDPISAQLRAYRWQGGNMQNLGVVPGTPGSFGSEISSDGTNVVGQSGQLAFRWSEPSGMVSLGDLPGGSESGAAYNATADGSIIVGLSSAATGFRGFRWTAATGIRALGDLPGGFDYSVANSISGDGTVTVGASTSSAGDRAVRWVGTNSTPQSLGLLRFNDSFSEALDISANGLTIVGVSGDGSYNEAFRWTVASGFEPLGDLPGGLLDSVATGVNADGSVVIGTGNPGDEVPDEPFYWTEARGMRTLWSVAVEAGIDMSAWQSLIAAKDLSADGGVVVGSGLTTAGEFAGFRMVIPEPASLPIPLLLAAALASRTPRNRPR